MNFPVFFPVSREFGPESSSQLGEFNSEARRYRRIECIGLAMCLLGAGQKS
jgi:hypothetical protein